VGRDSEKTQYRTEQVPLKEGCTPTRWSTGHRAHISKGAGIQLLSVRILEKYAHILLSGEGGVGGVIHARLSVYLRTESAEGDGLLSKRLTTMFVRNKEDIGPTTQQS